MSHKVKVLQEMGSRTINDSEKKNWNPGGSSSPTPGHYTCKLP